MNAADFAALGFLARDLAHRAHLKTRSYAQHMALQGFYEEIVELTDAFVEAHQGRYAELLDIPLLDNEIPGDITDVLQGQLDLIERSREDIVPSTETALDAQVDTIVTLYQSTLYKLRFLG